MSVKNLELRVSLCVSPLGSPPLAPKPASRERADANPSMKLPAHVTGPAAVRSHEPDPRVARDPAPAPRTDALAAQIEDVYRHPYDPRAWLRRADIFRRVPYPELVVGDAHKAQLLCTSILARARAAPDYSLGHRCGFWMRDEAVSGGGQERGLESAAVVTRFTKVSADAHAIVTENLTWQPDEGIGIYTPRAYPWMEPRHRFRDDGLMRSVNEEFAAREPGYIPGNAACCVLKRHAFGRVGDGHASADVLGVFAARDIKAESVILLDKSRTWGCTGPGKEGSLEKFKGQGCSEPLHPNLESDASAHDLRWIRDRAGVEAAEVILRCRLLLCCVEDGVAHPLDHPLIARLTPTYRRGRMKRFGLEHEIAVPNEMLQQVGVDIFADRHYDTWVMFVIQARMENNSWSDPIHTVIHPLFSLFNHSCEPNLTWVTKSNPMTMMLRTRREIQKGEQLFVEYDAFVHDQSLEQRRERLARWFDAPCQCSRCLREEGEAQGAEHATPNDAPATADWDTADKPVFPEDELNARLRQLQSQHW